MNTKENDKKIIYALLCFGCVTISFNVAAITAAIPSISLDLKLPDFLVSNIIPYYMIPYGMGALIYAPLTRFLSYRIVFVSSMALFAASCFMCGSVHSINQFFVARIIMGLAGASAIPLGLMIIGELFDKEVRGRLVGLFFSCSFFASLAGVIFSGIISWRWLFFIPAILGALLVICYGIFNSKLINKIHSAEVNYLKVFKDIKIKNVFIFIFIISALYHGVHKWFGVYLSRIYELDKVSISGFFVLMAIAGFMGQNIGGQISDKKSRMISCYVGIITLSLGTMLLLFKFNYLLLGLILILISMGWTIGHNGVSTVLTDFSNKDRPAIASLNSSVRFISGGIGFFISSLFVEKSFGITFFVIGLMMFLLVFILKKVIPQEL